MAMIHGPWTTCVLSHVGGEGRELARRLAHEGFLLELGVCA